MKVEITKREQPKEEACLSSLPVGTVFRYDGTRGPVAIKLDKGEVLLLAHGDGANWLALAGGWKDEPIGEILGQIVGVAVE